MRVFMCARSEHDIAVERESVGCSTSGGGHGSIRTVVVEGERSTKVPRVPLASFSRQPIATTSDDLLA